MFLVNGPIVKVMTYICSSSLVYSCVNIPVNVPMMKGTKGQVTSVRL